MNTAYELIDPSRWQPDITSSAQGIFKVQQFVTPQLRLTRPYSYADPGEYQASPRNASDYHGNFAAYRQQADEVLAASASLTDHQKSAAEFFDDKFKSLGFSALFLMHAHGLNLEEFVQLGPFESGDLRYRQSRSGTTRRATTPFVLSVRFATFTVISP